jgi:hypothetical protein
MTKYAASVGRHATHVSKNSFRDLETLASILEIKFVILSARNCLFCTLKTVPKLSHELIRGTTKTANHPRMNEAGNR